MMEEGEDNEFIMVYVFPFAEGKEQDEVIWAVKDVHDVDKFIDWALEIRKDFTDNHKRFLDGEYDDITKEDE